MSEKLSTPEPDTTVSVAIVYDSGSRGYPALSGRTRVLAEAVAKGARMVKGTAVTLIPVADRASYWEVLDAAERDRLRLPNLHRFGFGGAESVHGGDDTATVLGAAVEGQAGSRVHELRGHERRQTARAPAACWVRRVARDDLDHARPVAGLADERGQRRRPEPPRVVLRAHGAE